MIKKTLLIFLLGIFCITPTFSAQNQSYDNRYFSTENDNESEEEFYPEFEYPLTDETPSTANSSKQSSSKNYSLIYQNLEPADFSYLHDMDPDQYYDIKDTTWAPYPLLRLNSYIYFKNQTIEPGYYLINPREHNGKWYMLFKQNGRVMHIIPTYERSITPMDFYETHLPKPKLTKAQKIHIGVLNFIGKTKSSKRREPVKSYMEINDLENYFVSIIIYYGDHKYSTLFRTIRL
ncbi:MAG: hypothetical protein MJ237_02230 [bacterium]|nr:hypothetical protein [bacterium]